MADDISKAAFSEDIEDAKQTEDAERWSFDLRGNLEIWITVSPLGHEDEQFVVRLFWNQYPDPPSVQFVDPKTGALNIPKAWPKARGFRPPNDICANWTLEGFGLHPEWAKDPRYTFNKNGNVLLKSIRILQQELDETFTGRFE